MTTHSVTDVQSTAVRAFDTIAESFDDRFGHLLSVAAQRRSVRRALLRSYPPGSRLLELGGGTGEDALFLAQHGRRVVVTDGSERMMTVAAAKAREHGYEHMIETVTLPIERIADWTVRREDVPFDGAYSNFAALNCVADLEPVGRALAALVRPGGRCLLVVFGPFSVGEVVVQLGKGSVSQAFRRLHRRGPTVARLSGHRFPVWYPRPGQIERAFRPYFRLVAKHGIGLFVPPSDAEPGISRFPNLVRMMEAADRLISRPMSLFGDHVLLTFERTNVRAPVNV